MNQARRTLRLRVRLMPAQRAALTSQARNVVFCGGVGAGKSWTGALWCMQAPAGTKILVVAPSYRVLRDGTLATLQAICPGVRVDFAGMVARLPNGTKLYLRSQKGLSESVRSVEVDRVWLEEAAYLRRDAIQTATGRTRGSADGRVLATTTPRKGAALHAIYLATPRPDVELFTARTSDNPRISAAYIAGKRRDYGPRLSAQELDGEWVDVTGGMWDDGDIVERTPPKKAPKRVVVGVDPNAGGRDECGIVVVGQWDDGSCIVLDDASGHFSVTEWPGVVSDLAGRYKARVVVEINQGGDMVERVLRAVNPRLRIEPVRAVKSKRDRALPVSTMYRQGLVTHAETFKDLVAEMTGWDPDTAEGSPNRLDALVWALTWLNPAVKPAETAAASQALNAARPAQLSRLRT